MTIAHVSRSMPSRRWACGSVTLSPGISEYSALTRRVRSRSVGTCLLVSGTVLVTLNVPRDSAYMVRGKKGSTFRSLADPDLFKPGHRIARQRAFDVPQDVSLLAVA
jgi:hypothetical protein